MAYKTISGTVSLDDFQYVRDLITRGKFTGPTEIIREGIKHIKKTKKGQL